VLLFVSYSSMLGGAERQLLDFASAFPQPPALACPDGPLAGAALATGLRVFGLRRGHRSVVGDESHLHRDLPRGGVGVRANQKEPAVFREPFPVDARENRDRIVDVLVDSLDAVGAEDHE